MNNFSFRFNCRPTGESHFMPVLDCHVNVSPVMQCLIETTLKDTYVQLRNVTFKVDCKVRLIS